MANQIEVNQIAELAGTVNVAATLFKLRGTIVMSLILPRGIW